MTVYYTVATTIYLSVHTVSIPFDEYESPDVDASH